MPLSIEHGDLIVATQSELDSAALNELTLSSRMRVVPVMAQGQEIHACQIEAYGEAVDDQLFSDASDIHFESGDVIDAHSAIDDEPFSSTAGVTFDESGEASGAHILEAIQRALDGVKTGGTIDIDVRITNGARTTRIRATRDR